MLLNVTLFIDVLSPVAELSKMFREEGIDIVWAINALKRATDKIQTIQRKNLDDLPAFKYLKSKITETEDSITYQNITFSSAQYHKSVDLVKAKKNDIIAAMNECMSTRLESSDILGHIGIILNTEAWQALASPVK